MDERTLRKHFDDLQKYLSRLPGEARPGLTWADFSARMQAQRDIMLPLLHEVIAPPLLVSPPEGPAELGTDYNTWTETRRRKANLDAMRVLAQMKADGRNVPYPEERPYLEAFSGWGGIDVLKLPADPTIFEPDYVEAIEQYQRTAQLRPGDAGWGIPKTNVFAGLATQYFTAMSICEAMWSLVNRAAHVTVRTALEPSAGVGRFAQATPSSQTVQWSMVEYDPMLAQFLSALYPTAEVVPGRFETFAAEAAGQHRLFDAALLNPPYNRSGRSKGDRREDPEFGGWDLPQDYFVLRAASLLRPGGVLAFITPIGQLTGKGTENVKLRRWLSEWCHFAGAVVPPSDMFPGVLITPAIQVWVKRAPRAEGVAYVPTAEEEAIIRGAWLETEQAQHAVMGTWAPHPRYGNTADPIVVGEFDADAAGAVALRPLPAVEVGAIQAWNRMNRVSRVTVKPPSFRVPAPSYQAPGTGTAVAMPAPAVVDPGVALLDVTGQGAQEMQRQAVALAYRISKFQSLTRQVQGAPIAEAGRLELLLDLQVFVDTFGNPHQLPLQEVARDVVPLLNAWLPEGGPTPAFATEVSGRNAMEPPANSTLEQVIAWYSKHNGVCTYRDLAREIQRGILPGHTRYDPESLLVFAQVYIDPPALADETPTYYRREEYLTGDLAARQDRAAAAVEALELSLPEGATTPLLERFKAQVRLLQEVLPNPSILDIQLSIRGPDVTPEMMQNFIRHYTNWKYDEPVILAEKADDLWTLRVNPDVYVRESWVSSNRDTVQHLAAYLLRAGEALDVFDTTRGSRVQAYHGLELEERLALDRKLEAAFLSWVMDDEAVAEALTEAYTRRHAWRGRTYSTEPLPIARMSAAFMGNPAHGQPGLNPHQTSAVRRIADRGSGLIAHDVGAGKTFTGAAIAAYLRQLNYARKPIITMPLTVLANWYDEARRLLPDYRIGTLGLSIDMSGPVRKVQRDSASVRAEKWDRYRQGGYDLFLVPHPAMFRDVAMRDESLLDEMSRILWMRRGMGKDALEAEVVMRRIAEAEGKRDKTAEELEREKRYGNAEKIATLEARLEKREFEVRRLQKELEKHGTTAKGIEKLRAELEEMVNEKPFRPNYKPTDWRASDPVEVLWAYADEEFVPDLEPLETYQRGGRLNKKALVELIELHRPKPDKSEQQSIPLEPLVYWEDLGCDLLIIDEAHNFKNVWHASPRMGQSLLYMGSTSEDDDPNGMIWDMFLKTQYLLRNHNDRGIVLLTATPVKNSPMEIYSMLSYCSTELWLGRGVQHKEQFVDRYIDLEVTAGAAIDMDIREALGANFREQTLPELRGILDVYVDRQTTDDLLASGALRKVPQPRIWGVQKHEWIPMDPVQDALYDRVIEYVREKQQEAAEAQEAAAEKGDDNALYEAKRAAATLALLQMDLLLKTALDPRLLPHELEETRRILTTPKELKKLNEVQLENKTAKLAMLEDLGLDEVQAYYDGGVIPAKLQVLGQYVSSHQDCGHVVFADNKEMHPWVIDALVAYGIPREAIAIIDSSVPPAQRQEIAKKFTGAPAQVIEGVEVVPAIDPLQYLVVLGTSGAMAEGINLQGKTCAIHHLNLQWEPATLHQRNGRGVRQGNVHDVVDVLHYIAAKSFDGVQLDYVLGKKAWQDSLFDPDSRSLDLSGGMDRTELVVLATVRGDEELARQKLEEIRAKLAERQHQRLLDRAKRKYVSLVQVYLRARRAEPSKRDGAFAAADREAHELRALPDSVFPRKDLLDMIRQDVVYYDFDLDLAIPANRYVKFVVRGLPDLNVVVYEIKPASTWWTFKLRRHGQLQAAYVASARGLFVWAGGAYIDAFKAYEAGERDLIKIEPWTDADYETDHTAAIMTATQYQDLRTQNVGGTAEAGMVAQLAQTIHRNFVNEASAGSRVYTSRLTVPVPLLLPPEYEGGHTRLVVVIARDAVDFRWNDAMQHTVLGDSSLVLPGDWSTFVEHAARGEVYRVFKPDHPLILAAADDFVERELVAMVSTWFGKAWPIKSVERKWATAVQRKRRGEAALNDEGDENDD